MSTWRAVPRESIPWFPTVIDELCNGCKKCFKMCPTKVYEWDEEKNVPVVKNPLKCIVGCSTCANVCPTKAIVFPPREVLSSFRKF
jgi:CDP-4-dehydro-6-deoxyglucose reductase